MAPRAITKAYPECVDINQYGLNLSMKHVCVIVHSTLALPRKIFIRDSL